MAGKVKTLKPAKRKAGRPPATFSARDALLFGAGSAFGTLGFAEAGIDDICSAANVGRATFYRFFRGKDEIFAALLDTANAHVEAAVMLAVNEAKGVESQLEAGIEAFLRAQIRSGNLARVLSAEVLSGRFAKQRAEGIRVFVQMFRSGVRSLGLRQQDDFVLYGLIGALEAISLEMLTRGTMEDAVIERAKASMLKILKGTLLGNRRATGSPK
jgi:AcrR family transcriptional regulator